MDSTEKLRRLILELPWLSKNKSVSIEEFCATFAINRDQAIKDLTLLTFVGPSQFGGDLVDIQISDETITVIDDQNHENSIQLTPEELMVLVSSINLLMESDRTNLLLKNLFNKITTLLYEDSKVSDVNYDDVFDFITKSIKENKLIIIDYINGRNIVKEKVLVKPVSIEEHGNFKYLKAIDLGFNIRKSYRLDRILKVLLSDIKIEDSNELINNDKILQLNIRVPIWKKNILDKYNIENIKENETSLEFNLPFFDSSYVKTLIYSLGKGIKIKANEDIKKDILTQIDEDINRLS